MRQPVAPVRASPGAATGAVPNPRTRRRHMRKIIALGLWLGADTLEVIRGGLLAAAVALLGDES